MRAPTLAVCGQKQSGSRISSPARAKMVQSCTLWCRNWSPSLTIYTLVAANDNGYNCHVIAGAALDGLSQGRIWKLGQVHSPKTTPSLFRILTVGLGLLSDFLMICRG